DHGGAGREVEEVVKDFRGFLGAGADGEGIEEEAVDDQDRGDDHVAQVRPEVGGQLAPHDQHDGAHACAPWVNLRKIDSRPAPTGWSRTRSAPEFTTALASSPRTSVLRSTTRVTELESFRPISAR